MMNDHLHKDNLTKDREIRQLNKDVQQNEQTIMNLRNELSFSKYHTPDVSKKDVEVAAGCCAECGDWEPVKEKESSEVTNYKDKIQKMEKDLKTSNVDVIALRASNMSLREEVRSLHSACTVFANEARAARQRADFKDEIIRELHAQLKRTKAECKDAVSELMKMKPRGHKGAAPPPPLFESVTIECVRHGSSGAAERRRPAAATRALSRDRHSLSDDCRSPRLVTSRDDISVANE